MALITCEHCGKQLSDKAAACPHCGAPHTPVPAAPQIPTDDGASQRPAGNRKKLILGICAAVAVLAVAAAVALSLLGGQSSAGEIPASVPANHFVDERTDSSQAEAKTYDVTLHVECRRNAMQNKYDVDILVNDQFIATLGHGKTDDYPLKMREGSYQVEFRVNGKTLFGNDIYDPEESDTYCVKTIRVSGDETFSYKAELVYGNGIAVEQLS